MNGFYAQGFTDHSPNSKINIFSFLKIRKSERKPFQIQSFDDFWKNVSRAWKARASTHASTHDDMTRRARMLPLEASFRRVISVGGKSAAPFG